MRRIERTSYETNPVESPEDALRAFVEAYDVLQAVLSECGDGEAASFSDELKTAMYRPVQPAGYDCPPISLYEIGVVYYAEGLGRYDINNRKLKAAIIRREADVRALFVQEDGILPHLCEILPQFTETPRHEFIYTATLRFLNECRRLIAMWA
jgi:hypothetical protein